MEFNKRWEKAKDTSLYVPHFLKPNTQREFFLLKYWEVVEEIIKNEKIGVAMDLGCGRGTMSQYLYHRKGIKNLFLVDKSDEALNLAESNIINTGINMNKVFFKNTINDIGDGGLDLIVSVGLMEHIKNPTESFMEQYRVLKKGGLMIAIIMPKKKSRQRFNVFGKDNYFRTDYQMWNYVDFTGKVGFKSSATRFFPLNPYPLFTQIPTWLDKLITKFYLLVDKFYSFNRSEDICQAHILICRK